MNIFYTSTYAYIGERKEGQVSLMEQANMIALVAALLITTALAAPLALTLEDFDRFTAKHEGPLCAQLAQFEFGVGIVIGQRKWRSAKRAGRAGAPRGIQQQQQHARTSRGCLQPSSRDVCGPRRDVDPSLRAPCAMPMCRRLPLIKHTWLGNATTPRPDHCGPASSDSVGKQLRAGDGPRVQGT